MNAPVFTRLTFRAAILGALLVLSGAATTAMAQMPGGRQQTDMSIDAAMRQKLIDASISTLRTNYVFPETAKKIETALRQHQRRGDYDKITSAQKLSATLTEHMNEVAKDKHLAMFYSEKDLPEESKDKKPSAEQRAGQLAEMKAQNFGVERIERLPFNIGYLNLRGFAPAKDAADTLAAAMSVLGNTDSLIIDLRKNGGGDPSTVTLLASYFLDERTHLTDIYYREGDRTEQMWSSDTVQGLPYGQTKDIYILTSKHTFSAAEDFSFAMKNLKRATIVGETTGGGAHPGDVMRLDKHFAMFVPNGRSMNPVSKLDWEGVGVAPDLSVRAEDAFKTAQIAVLKKMSLTEKNPGKLARLNERIAKVDSENTDGTMAR